MHNFLHSYLEKFKQNFSNPEMELRILLNRISNKKKEILLSNFEINNIDIFKLNKAFNRRIKREPISKIFNSKYFWDYDFFVNKEVLDPRPETELIIEKILEIFPFKNKKIKILDMCTGSGCIAISLAKEYSNAEITATDISQQALNIAKINAKKMDCINQIKFINCDLLDKINFYDIVISNPPYLSEAEYKKISLEILLYEPKIALVASNNGYEFYQRIADILPKILHNNSKVFIEIGSTQAEKVVNIFKSKNIHCCEIVKDLQKLNRVLILNKS